MMYTTLLFAAAVATATAQSVGPVLNTTTGQFICPKDQPNGAFCAGDSLKTNIIIRCTNGIGQPGNCNDNLAGFFPFGVNFAPCWQTSPSSGDAACSKNCIVEGGSGKSNGTFTLPYCTPVPSTTSSSSTASSTGYPTTTPSSSIYSSSTVTSTGTSTSYGISTTSTSTYTTTYCPPTTTPSTSTSTYIYPTSPIYNSTVTTVTTQGTTTPPTNTPFRPTSTTSATPTQFTGAAVAKSAGAGLGLAFVGVFAAYFL